MATYQVEEYYLHMYLFCVTKDEKSKIEEHLDNEGYSSYEFQDDDSALVVDGLESEQSGEILEGEIKSIAGL